MKGNQFTKTKYRVQFKYTNSPTRQQIPLDSNNPSFPSPKSNSPTIISQQLQYKSIQNYPSMHRIDRCIYQTSPTMKKQILDIEALTLRKQGKRKYNKQIGEQGNFLQSEGRSGQSTSRSQEALILRQQIRYMRQKLIQAENSQKSIKLQFQLYKASHDPQTLLKPTTQQPQQSAQSKGLLDKVASLQRQNHELHLLLFEQSKKAIRLEQALQQEQLEHNTALNQLGELKNESENKTKEISYLHQQLFNICQNNQLFFEQNTRFKQILHEKDHQISCAHEQLITMKNMNINALQKVVLLEGQIENMANSINQLRMRYQINMQNLSGSQDMMKDYEDKVKEVYVFQNRLEEDHIKLQQITLLQNKSMKEQNVVLKNENTALKTNNQILISNQRIMLNEIEWLKSQLNLQTSYLHSQLDKLHSKHQQEIQTLNSHNQVTIKQKQAQILALHEQIGSINKDRNQLTQVYEQNINNLVSLHERQLQYFKNIDKSQKTILSSVQAKSLSQQQLHQHLHQLKNQHQHITAEEFFLLQQQNTQLKQQLQNINIDHQQNLQSLRQRYEKEMSYNNEEYTQQLAIYMKEVQILMDEMDKIRGKKQICEEIIEESAQEQQNDNQQNFNSNDAAKDLLKFGDDISQVLKPSINGTPIRALQDDDGQKPQPVTDHRFMLQQIIDLDSKINNYIMNYNKRKSQEDPSIDHQ